MWKFHLFLQSANRTFFALIFVLQRWFEVRWKALTLTHPTVGQTLKFDHLEPISLALNRRGSDNQSIISDLENWRAWFQNPRLLKSDEIGSKWSNFSVWPTVGRTSVRAFQHTSNQRRTTKRKAKNFQFADCRNRWNFHISISDRENRSSDFSRPPIQNWGGRLQSFRFQILTHRSTHNTQSFPAHFESAPKK